jgi:hypothetical protein
MLNRVHNPNPARAISEASNSGKIVNNAKTTEDSGKIVNNAKTTEDTCIK